jgi:hypothetical protein
MASKRIEVQRNLNDGDIYEKRLVDDGLFVCPKCYHAYIDSCSNCGAEKPSAIEVQNQWSEVYLYDCGTGELVE